MSSEIWVALIAFLGTSVGSSIGVITSSKLTNYRLQELEQRVSKHNCIVERTYKLEEKVSNMTQRMDNFEKN